VDQIEAIDSHADGWNHEKSVTAAGCVYTRLNSARQLGVTEYVDVFTPNGRKWRKVHVNNSDEICEGRE